MKVLLLGSTGQTGTHLIDQALAAGHQVRAFARDAAKINKATGVLFGCVSSDQRRLDA